jgi:hypothetical protein
MSAERTQLLRDFDADGPEKVRENISLNRYDRRTLARAVLWLEQRHALGASPPARRAQAAGSSSAPLGNAPRARAIWFAAAAGAAVIIAGVAFMLGRFGT